MSGIKTENYFLALSERFKAYSARFLRMEEVSAGPIQLKTDHTFRVVDEITKLYARHSHPGVSLDLAASTALLHDIGRFQQYASFGTYDERISINHAALSVVVIDQLDLLACFQEREQELLREAVLHHNAQSVPARLSGAGAFLLRLLRDADKLDIWRVVLDLDTGDSEDDRCSAEVVELVKQFRSVPYSLVGTAMETRLFRISWVFDISFAETIRAVLERGYLERMASRLPDTREFADLSLGIRQMLLCRLEACSP